MRTSYRNLQELIKSREQWATEMLPIDKPTFMTNWLIRPMPDKDKCQLVPLKVQGVKQEEIHELTPWALSQLITRLGYSKSVYDKLTPKLNAEVMNYLNFKDGEGKEALLRTISGNKVRAVVSNKYGIFDVLELLTEIEPVVTNYGGIIRWDSITDEVFHLGVTFPMTTRELKKGSLVEAGVWLSDSEVGLRSVVVGTYIYTLSCLNGAIKYGGDDFFRFRHTGKSERIRDAFNEALKHVLAKGQGVLDDLEKAMNKVVDADYEKLVKSATETQNLTQEQYRAIVMQMAGAGEDLTNLYGLTQAVSWVANNQEGEESFKTQCVALTVLERGLN